MSKLSRAPGFQMMIRMSVTIPSNGNVDTERFMIDGNIANALAPLAAAALTSKDQIPSPPANFKAESGYNFKLRARPAWHCAMMGPARAQ